MCNEWFKDFFTGVVVRSWEGAMPAEQTARETAFLLERLGLEPGGRVVDIHCGDGRHTLGLAAAGLCVTGVDLSEELLGRAGQKARQAGLQATWHHADSREELPFEPFDGAICMGNSFGYLDAGGMKQLIANIVRSLRPRARWVIDSGMIAESILPHLPHQLWFRSNGIWMLFESSYVVAESRLDTACTFIEDGREETRRFSHWVYTLGEITRMLAEAGMEVTATCGSCDGEPYRVGSRYAYLVAWRR